MRKVYSIIIFLLLMTASCSKDKEENHPKGQNVCYVILDTSSNSYSSMGGKEENYIDLNTSYVHQWIDMLYQQINQHSNKSDLILFFNYIDEDSKGNKELYLKVPAFEPLDSTYHSKIGQITSTKSAQVKYFKEQKQKRQEAIEEFNKNKELVLSQIEKMLKKSSEAKGSDCSGALQTANKKLTDYLEIKKDFQIKSKTIIAFSDLVNFPVNNVSINLDFKIIRPGYTSAIPYIKSDQPINVGTQQEFQELINNLLDN